MDQRPSTPPSVAIYAFGDCEVDIRRRELRRAGQSRSLEPQVFDVLVYLLRQRDRAVPKQELFDHVWRERFVTDATLSSRIMAARKAIGDSGQDQGMIRTVRGHGYRFVGHVEERAIGAEGRPAPVPPAVSSTGATLPDPAAGFVVGRDRELEQLRLHLAAAEGGTRQLVFVTGEPGRGKTAIVDALVADARGDPRVRVAHGQCLEHHGAGEAYLPVLEALGRLCRGSGGDEVVGFLAARAPMWLAQMPWLVPPDEFAIARQRAMGAARERMLREIVEVIEALAAERPLIVVLEDLHWSDYSTLDLLALLGRRREPARLLLVGTFRPAEAQARSHPLGAVVRDLRLRGLCSEVPLPPLEEGAVEAYLAARFPEAPLPVGLAGAVLRRTDGNPLFVRLLVDAWITEHGLANLAGRDPGAPSVERLVFTIPATLRELIEHQLDRLSQDDRNLLAAASVVGREFAVAPVAAALMEGDEAVEARCQTLTRSGLVQVSGVSEWPDGTVSARFAFVHDLHRDVLYESIPPNRLAALHQRIGTRLATGYGPNAAESAAELALHFRRGRDARQAVRYLQAASEQAVRRNAYHEAIDHLRAALAESARLPDDTERSRAEIEIQGRLAAAFIPFKGWAAPEVERAYARGRELCRQTGTHAQSCRMLFGLATLQEYRGDHRAAQEVLEERLQLTQTLEDADLLAESHELLACALFHRGAFTEALAFADQALAVCDPAQQRPLTFLYDEHPAVACHAWAAHALWVLGYPDRGLARLHRALDVANEVGHLHSLAVAQTQAATHYQMRREPDRALEWAEAAATLSAEQGFEYRLATAEILRGWGLAATGRVEDGLREMRHGLAAYRATGAEMDRPYFLSLLAEVCGWSGRFDEGLAAIAEGLALAGERGGFYNEPELHRLRGWLVARLGQADSPAQAMASLAHAGDLARRHGARLLELRTAVDAARLSHRLGDQSVHRASLADVYGQFTEGRETVDLREARHLLDDAQAWRDDNAR